MGNNIKKNIENKLKELGNGIPELNGFIFSLSKEKNNPLIIIDNCNLNKEKIYINIICKKKIVIIQQNKIIINIIDENVAKKIANFKKIDIIEKIEDGFNKNLGIVKILNMEFKS